MKNLRLSLNSARRLALRAQMLDNRIKAPKGKEGIAQTIERLGYVQIDTIAVVERAHHHTLWTRRPDYNAQMLDELHAKDRRIFEYWGHEASYLPMGDFRYYLPMMRQFADLRSRWVEQRLKKHGHLMKPVLERIRQEGAMSSRDFSHESDKKRGTWWDWRPAKVALELLFWRGELLIKERRNFQRIYDLPERVLPSDLDTSVPAEQEVGHFFVKRALSAYGVATEREIHDHLRAARKAVLSNALQELISAGEVQRLEIESLDGAAAHFALSQTLDNSTKLRARQPGVFILSPFDNLIIQRQRTLRLFHFDYALECYTPAPKRKYGYFVLPILWGERFAGRFDAKADRKQSTFIVRNLVFEPDFNDFDAFLPPFSAKLWQLAAFNQCGRIKVEKVKPGRVARAFRKSLENHR